MILASMDHKPLLSIARQEHLIALYYPHNSI